MVPIPFPGDVPVRAGVGGRCAGSNLGSAKAVRLGWSGWAWPGSSAAGKCPLGAAVVRTPPPLPLLQQPQQVLRHLVGLGDMAVAACWSTLAELNWSSPRPRRHPKASSARRRGSRPGREVGRDKLEPRHHGRRCAGESDGRSQCRARCWRKRRSLRSDGSPRAQAVAVTLSRLTSMVSRAPARPGTSGCRYPQRPRCCWPQRRWRGRGFLG